MNSQQFGLQVAGVLFGLMCLAQLMRLLIRPEILVAGHVLPLWPSILAVVVLGGVTAWMWKLAQLSRR